MHIARGSCACTCWLCLCWPSMLIHACDTPAVCTLQIAAELCLATNMPPAGRPSAVERRKSQGHSLPSPAM